MNSPDNLTFTCQITMSPEPEQNGSEMNTWLREGSAEGYVCGGNGTFQIWTRNMFVDRRRWADTWELVCWRKILVLKLWIFMFDHFVTCVTKKEWARWWSLVRFSQCGVCRGVCPGWPLTIRLHSLNENSMWKDKKAKCEMPFNFKSRMNRDVQFSKPESTVMGHVKTVTSSVFLDSCPFVKWLNQTVVVCWQSFDFVRTAWRFSN